MTIREKLTTAHRDAQVVRVTREACELGGELGYVIALERDLLLLLCISNEIRFDGFVVLRVEDVSDIELPHDHADFVEEALELRGESVSEAPAIPLSDLAAALRSAGALYPLVAIHRELAATDICHIGKVVDVSESSVALIEIDPDAEWEEEVTRYALSEITRMEFGGGYEEALALVGGAAPSDVGGEPSS